MTGPKSSDTRLVADIGGTNSRLALFDLSSGELRAQINYLNSDFSGFEEVVADWLQQLEEPVPDTCCLAIAAPPFADRINMLNIDWSFSLRELATRFGFSRIRGINDFVGNAYALPHLNADELFTLRAGPVDFSVGVATIGPGTGLGGCTLTCSGAQTAARHAEPGHMGLTPATELEFELFRALQTGQDEIFAEYLLSGSGLFRLYQAHAQVLGEPVRAGSQREVSELALDGECSLCQTTLGTFCALLGSVCGDFVLANGAFGGLYLAGGIVPRILDLLVVSTFLERFQHKGKMAQTMTEIPVYAIISGRSGLLGAAHAPLNQ